MSYLKRAAAIHDISCYGKSSLTIVLPVLSAAGIETCPLPTALLSAHTGIKSPTFFDLTGEMRKITAHWKALDLRFDCIYSGFLGSERQIDIVHGFMDNYARALKIVDPVMGDNGEKYKTYTDELCEMMAELVKVSDITTPNLTEAAILLGEKYPGPSPGEELVKDWLYRISELGPETVIITGIADGGSIMNMAFSKKENEYFTVKKEYIASNIDGSGDLFTSVLTAGILTGLNLYDSLELASDFVCKAIRLTVKRTDITDGLVFEPLLANLSGDIKRMRGTKNE